MGTWNPVALYYDLLLAASVLLTGVYIFKWHKHYDVHITMVFVLLPVVSLGYSMLAHSTVLQEALAANKIIYLGSCYLQMIVLLLVCNLCGVRIRCFLKMLFFVVSTVFYLFVLNPMGSDLFYRNTELVIQDGIPLLRKEYGWLHTAFQAVVILYFLLSIGIIVFSFFRKNQVSRKILVLLFLPEVVAVVCFFLGKRLFRNFELLPGVYVLAQVTYLVIVSRISLYDVTDTAIDSLAQEGGTGFLSIDYGYHYLGSNETAKEIFPVLRKLTVDLSIRRRKSFCDIVVPWLEAYKADEGNNTAHYEKDGRYYQINLAPLYNNRREKGFQLTITDDTENQEHIHLIQHYNSELEEEVAKKTAHIVEMHDQLILSMATMVESRDNSTGGHIRRTSEGVRILLGEVRRGEMPELTPEFRKKLIKAAPMHDLGKIAVDDEVLRKPGRFTPEEYEKMKAHAAEGARIVHEILKDTDDDEFHLIAENVAHYHHERWDGSGYPEGLKGGEIPREARIMAVADVYDALVSRRVYKDKMSFEKADRIMMEGMGTQFAPEMEEIYVRAKPKLEAYYNSLD